MNAVKQNLTILRKREEFLALAESGKKWVAPGLILQAAAATHQTVRLGLTASGKIGGAVLRNRARRRLRALAQEILTMHAAIGYDYVLIARVATIARAYDTLRSDLTTALKKLNLWRT